QPCRAETSGEHGAAGNTLHRCSPSGWRGRVTVGRRPRSVVAAVRTRGLGSALGRGAARVLQLPRSRPECAVDARAARFVPATLPRSRGEREDRRPSPTTPTTSDRLESSRSPWVVEFVRDTVLSSVSGADEGLVESSSRSDPDSPYRPP